VPNRRRPILRRCLAIAAIVLAAVWGASGYYQVTWWPVDSRYTAGLSGGLVGVTRKTYVFDEGMRRKFIQTYAELILRDGPLWIMREPTAPRWEFTPRILMARQRGDPWILTLPLWPAPLACAAAWFFYLRRTPQGLCPRCRYNRQSLATDAACPECGQAP